MIGFFVILMMGLWLSDSVENKLLSILIIIAIILPFFINRFIFKRGSVGGESFRMTKYADGTIIYKSKDFHINKVYLELVTRELRYNTINILYLIIDEDNEIKLRTDYQNKNQSVTYNLAFHLQDHLDLKLQNIER